MKRVSLTFSYGDHLCVLNFCGGKRRQQNAILCLSFTVFDETTNPREDTAKSCPRGEFLWVWKVSSCLANRCMPCPLCVFHFNIIFTEGSNKRILRPVLFRFGQEGRAIEPSAMVVQVCRSEASGAIVGRITMTGNVPSLCRVGCVVNLGDPVGHECVKTSAFVSYVLQHSFRVTPKDGIFDVNSQLLLDNTAQPYG